MHVRGSRSLVSSFSLLSDMLYVAIVVVGASIWIVRVVFRLISFCLFVMVVRSEVVWSPKNFSGNFDFALVSSNFFDDSSSLASRSNAVESFGDF